MEALAEERRLAREAEMDEYEDEYDDEEPLAEDEAAVLTEQDFDAEEMAQSARDGFGSELGEAVQRPERS